MKAAAAADFDWFDDVAVWILDRTADAPAYELLEDVRYAHHEDTAEARIVLALKSYSADVDGRVKLGECIKAPELWQRIAEVDAVIALNKELWPHLKPDQRRALLDHELCHLAPKLDPKTLDHAETPDGIKLWRIRKHDIEEFAPIVRRHGFWDGDLQRFAAAVIEAKAKPLFRDQLIEAMELEKVASHGEVVRMRPRRKR